MEKKGMFCTEKNVVPNPVGDTSLAPISTYDMNSIELGGYISKKEEGWNSRRGEGYPVIENV